MKQSQGFFIALTGSIFSCSGLRDIYRTEIQQQQEHYNKDMDKWKEMERCMNMKLDEKKQELEDNLAYYTQREAELETKIDELMTRLQEQTAAYMKLQSEFDNYEWYDEEEEEEGEEGEVATTKKSRESLQVRSRPPTRPPTREEVDRLPPPPPPVAAEERAVPEEAVFEPTPLPRGGGDNGGPDPEVPPRRTAQEDSRASWTDSEQST